MCVFKSIKYLVLYFNIGEYYYLKKTQIMESIQQQQQQQQHNEDIVEMFN